MWLCTHEACKVARSVHVNSDLASQYECDHVKLAKNSDIATHLLTKYFEVPAQNNVSSFFGA